MHLSEKQAVKAKKSTEVSAGAKKALSCVLSACRAYVVGRCFPAERKFG